MAAAEQRGRTAGAAAVRSGLARAALPSASAFAAGFSNESGCAVLAGPSREASRAGGAARTRSGAAGDPAAGRAPLLERIAGDQQRLAVVDEGLRVDLALLQHGNLVDDCAGQPAVLDACVDLDAPLLAFLDDERRHVQVDAGRDIEQ